MRGEQREERKKEGGQLSYAPRTDEKIGFRRTGGDYLSAADRVGVWICASSGVAFEGVKRQRDDEVTVTVRPPTSAHPWVVECT